MSSSTVPPKPLSDQAKLIISLLLVVHLFCAAIGLLAAMAPSRLVMDLHSKALGFYTQSLGLDLNYDWSVAPLYLTQGSDLDVDSILELEIPADPHEAVAWDSPTRNTTRYVWPEVGSRGTERHARYLRLAAFITRVARDDQNAAPVLAQAVAHRAMLDQGVKEARIRVRRHLLQAIDDLASSEELRLDPYSTNFYFPPATDERYFEYEARLVEGNEGPEVIVVQITTARDVAPIRGRSGSAKE